MFWISIGKQLTMVGQKVGNRDRTEKGKGQSGRLRPEEKNKGAIKGWKKRRRGKRGKKSKRAQCTVYWDWRREWKLFEGNEESGVWGRPRGQRRNVWSLISRVESHAAAWERGNKEYSGFKCHNLLRLNRGCEEIYSSPGNKSHYSPDR